MQPNCAGLDQSIVHAISVLARLLTSTKHNGLSNDECKKGGASYCEDKPEPHREIGRSSRFPRATSNKDGSVVA